MLKMSNSIRNLWNNYILYFETRNLNMSTYMDYRWWVQTSNKIIVILVFFNVYHKVICLFFFVSHYSEYMLYIWFYTYLPHPDQFDNPTRYQQHAGLLTSRQKP